MLRGAAQVTCGVGQDHLNRVLGAGRDCGPDAPEFNDINPAAHLGQEIIGPFGILRRQGGEPRRHQTDTVEHERSKLETVARSTVRRRIGQALPIDPSQAARAPGSPDRPHQPDNKCGAPHADDHRNRRIRKRRKVAKRTILYGDHRSAIDGDASRKWRCPRLRHE